MNNEPAVMWFDGENRVVFLESSDPLGWGQRYRDWIAEGNTPEEWVAEDRTPEEWDIG